MPGKPIKDVVRIRVEDLDRLYLIAQFFSSSTAEASALVDKTLESVVDVSFTDRVKRLISIADLEVGQKSESVAGGEHSSLPIPDNRGAAFLTERIALVFFSLEPADRLRLWASLQTVRSEVLSAPLGNDIIPDPVMHFVELLAESCTDLERTVYTDWFGADRVVKGLKHFWETSFGPTPPTLLTAVSSRSKPLGTSDITPESPSEDSVAPKSRFARVMLYGILIVTAAFLGYTFTDRGLQPQDAPASTDLIDFAIENAENVAASLPSESEEQVERFMKDRFHRDVNVPVISGYRMEGIGIQHLSDSSSVPVLLYASVGNDDRAVLFVWSYALLQPGDSVVMLSRETLNQIENPDGVDIRESTSQSAVVWRDSDDIFVGITTEDPQDFAGLLVRE
jgi:hypothetical protein